MNGILLLGLGLFLFFLGLFQSLTSRKFLGFLIGIELILNAANLNLAGFIQIQPDRSDLSAYLIMILAFAAIELVAGFSLLIWIGNKELTDDFKLIS